MKLLGRVNNLLLSKIKTFSTYLMLGVSINYYQEIKIDLISIIEYR